MYITLCKLNIWPTCTTLRIISSCGCEKKAAVHRDVTTSGVGMSLDPWRLIRLKTIGGSRKAGGNHPPNV